MSTIVAPPAPAAASAAPPPPAPTKAAVESLRSTSPIDGALLGEVPVHGAAEVGAAVARARTASASWAAKSFAERATELVRWRRAIADHVEELAQLVHRENGKTVLEATSEIFMALSHLDHAASRAEKALAPERVSGGLLANFRCTVSYHPLGVIGVIGPWNYPVFTPMGSIAYALAAGNAVVFKPSELTPLIGVKLVELAAASFSVPDLLQIVTGAGPTGAALCKAGVDKLAFTGSTATGKRVMAACAETLTPVLMELGGKDPMIVADDADLAKAVDGAVFGALANTGQACISIERCYVAEPVYDRFVEMVVAEVRKLRVGGDDAHLGAMTSPAQVEIVRAHLEDAQRRGAKILTGGADAIVGNFIQPTVVVDVTDDMLLIKDETFGPVLPIIKVASVEDALRRANGTRFGLGSAIFGRHARELADRIVAGMTSVNSVLAFSAIASLPFGGVGDSGFGRIHGDHGLREFTRTKATAEERLALPMNLMSFKLPGNMATRLAGTVKTLYGSGPVARAKDLFGRLRRG
jgi:acyl-CoA reductase-like NAD-dependent aldehyde dehydrogenase